MFPLYSLYSSLAQLAEHLTVNQVVAGSSPAGGANRKPEAYASGFLLALHVELETPMTYT